ncbi:MAG TPA: aromatic-ring-hydroxylating dioxygenase subunit beta [Micromonosporaceae bacterium]|nr:aromatic-ring-hydroxylating dioxygenase subunit beta [Micromonosporaceae bacterium]
MDRTRFGTRMLPGSEAYAEVQEWLHREAELLDDREERAWLANMVSRDVVYQVPIRQTVRRADGDGFARDGFHLDESYGSLLVRVERNLSPSAWTEDPPPRTRRFVTNIRATAEGDDAFGVRSNLLIYRTRQDEAQPSLLAAERRDLLCRTGDALLLRRRLVLLDLTVLQVPNLGYFF